MIAYVMANKKRIFWPITEGTQRRSLPWGASRRKCRPSGSSPGFWLSPLL